jgi:tRNA pseudouridine55 synthase
VNGARPRRARARVDGVLLLDKPHGITSQAAVTRVKQVFNAAKAGHTGTLDPAATGLLPIGLGEATKFSGVLLDASKAYVATLLLGQTTTTGDLEGDVTSTAPVEVDLAAIEATLPRFMGEITQTPPMYSALKHAGRPLYEYAREGAEIARARRSVTVSSLALLGYDGRELTLEVACSKGTYVRVLAEDIGEALGCGACLAALRRTRVGHLEVSDAISLQALSAMSEADRAARLLPADAMLSDLPVVDLDRDQVRRITTGLAVECDTGVGTGVVRIYGPDKAFLGVASAIEPGRLQPRRLVASGGVQS